jgi:antitoxin component YwqK of YwqJK toxin-antitoxin module
MHLNETYANGQPVSTIEGDVLTYYFKDGIVKARGGFTDGKMEGAWVFNRADGALWQEGTFTDGKKNGRWLRYDKNGILENTIRSSSTTSL